MVKKNNRTVWIVVGIVVLLVLIFGIIPSMTGNAIWPSSTNKQLYKLECDEFYKFSLDHGSYPIGNSFCIGQNYTTCVSGAAFIVGSEGSITLLSLCDMNVTTDWMSSSYERIYPGADHIFLPNSGVHYNCCRVVRNR